MLSFYLNNIDVRSSIRIDTPSGFKAKSSPYLSTFARPSARLRQRRMHNMADPDVPISNHLTMRNGICQDVRRVPEDVRDSFPFERIQKSLSIRDTCKRLLWISRVGDSGPV